MSAIETLKEACRKQTTQTIFEAVVLIGGGMVNTDKRMVRAALIDIYIERTSPEDGDALMDLIGL